MIFQTFFTIFRAILLSILNLLPEGSELPTAVDTAFNFYIEYIKKFETYIPIKSLFIVVGLVLAIEVSIGIFSGVEWVYNKIRGSG